MMGHKIKDGRQISESSWSPMRRGDIESKTMDEINVFIDEIPNLPVHVHKLLKIVSDFESDSGEVAKVASSDPAMVSKIIKAVNSSFYGLSQRTDNLHFAIVLLGFNEVRNIALQTSFSKMLGEGWTYKGYDTRGLWEHSYLVSVCAETIGKEKDPKRAGELLTQGILHDIGKYVLFKLTVLMKKKGINPFKSGNVSQKSYIIEKEEVLFCVNHPIVGSMLAKKWGLSERICSVLEYHHHPSFWGIDSIPAEYLEDVVMISFSDLIVNHITGKENQLPEPSPEFFEILGLTPPLKNVITEELQTKIGDAQKFITYIK